MTDDDFDKVDDNFANEFDFVDEDQNKTGKSGSGFAPQQKSTGGSFVGKFLLIALLAGGGYYGYITYLNPESKAPVLPHPAIPAVSKGITPPPVNKEDTTNNLVQNLENATSKPSLDRLASAVPPPQPKTFEQVQQDLKPAAKPAIPDEINSTLDSISEEMTLNVNQIKNLETTINSLSGTLEQLNKSISAMDNRVLGLTETVDGLSQDLTYVKKIIVDEDLDLTNPGTLKFSNKPKGQPMSSSGTPGYTVHAIIPGRAWLKSSGGQIMTVTEGDKIGDYGTIAVIDAANGLVRTSSGITFR